METTTLARILVVDDDSGLRELLSRYLTEQGYDVVAVGDGTAMDRAMSDASFDLLILDLMLPGEDGLSLLRRVVQKHAIPVIMVSARGEDIDRIIGLEVGADDYMTKPFSMRELLARLGALLRRAEMSRPVQGDETEPLKIGDLEIDTARHRVTRKGSSLTLTAREYDLLVFLARNRGFVFTRDQLLEKVWGYDYAGDTRTVDVHVRWLRQKIEPDPSQPSRLITVRGAGYKLED